MSTDAVCAAILKSGHNRPFREVGRCCIDFGDVENSRWRQNFDCDVFYGWTRTMFDVANCSVGFAILENTLYIAADILFGSSPQTET